MTAADDYLAEVGGAMMGMDPRVRKDILDELRSHLADAAAANGGDVARAVVEMGPAVRVGREYRALYGYSAGYRLIFTLIAAFLAAFTLPVLQGSTSSLGNPFYIPNTLALPFLVLLIVWLLWVSFAAGSRAGLYAGLGAFVARIGTAFGLVLGPASAILTTDGLAVLLISSALLVLVGWLPGTAKKTWTKPRAEL